MLKAAAEFAPDSEIEVLLVTRPKKAALRAINISSIFDSGTTLGSLSLARFFGEM